MRIMTALAGLAMLGACSQADRATFEAQLTAFDLIKETERAYADSYQDLPFDRGTVYVVANEHGDLHTYALTPCGGAHVCGATGHVGRVQRTPDYFVVTGAYAGRTFYLSPGGDGYLKWRGVYRDLAWN